MPSVFRTISPFEFKSVSIATPTNGAGTDQQLARAFALARPAVRAAEKEKNGRTRLQRKHNLTREYANTARERVAETFECHVIGGAM
jgi:hypothetical protein